MKRNLLAEEYISDDVLFVGTLDVWKDMLGQRSLAVNKSTGVHNSN